MTGAEGMIAGEGVKGMMGYATARMQAKEQHRLDAIAAARESLNKQSQIVMEAEDTRRNRIMDIISAFRQGVA